MNVSVREQTDVAFARREALELARVAGLDSNDAGAVGIVVTEAATNLIKHAGGGDIIARNLHGSDKPALEIIATDRGRGMNDTARCFQDGYSTAGSPGNGLGAIARLSLFHQVYSVPGNGTVLLAHVGRPSHAVSSVEVGAISLPYPGQQACGDAWVVRASQTHCRIVVADGLGHGPLAGEAARLATDMVREAGAPEAVQLMQAMHDRLRSTRGAAVAIADWNLLTPAVAFTSVGNVSGCVLDDSGSRRQMVSMNGTVGHEMRRASTFSYPAGRGALVILHSDGIATHWSADKYPGLFTRRASLIAAVLMRDFRRVRDDATVVVVRGTRPDRTALTENGSH